MCDTIIDQWEVCVLMMGTSKENVILDRVRKFTLKRIVNGLFSTNKTDRHDITEILLKVALNTISLTQTNGLFLNLSDRIGDTI
jgi:hypothetical protein